MAASLDKAEPVALAFTLPLPPGVNNQYVTAGKRRVLSAAAQRFHRDAAKRFAALRVEGAIRPAAEAALRDALLGVYLTFYFETPMRRDLDGGLKIALDAIGRGLGFDDRAVVDLHLTKRIDPLHPRLEVDIETIADWEFDRTYVVLAPPGPAEANAADD
ncbi:MAG TPA: RusA family crossover junction endodeoxyribonuclease [Thermomicrobiales bacterium]|jgi:crossover junction endodeoxyribonuclease RusA|nr:RusA family crossover junction endodeoxyribonuclease [Thermomicrobiales bacterium]